MGRTLIKETIKSIAASIKGVKPAFDEYHIIKALLILYEKEPIGRQLLSKYLGIGITSTRTLIKRLKRFNLINVDPIGGCILTEHGRRIAEKILDLVVGPFEVTNMLDDSLLVYKKAFAFLIKRGINMLEFHGISTVRDIVVRHGARACIIVYILNSTAYIPPYKEFNEELNPSLKKLRNLFQAQDQDVIIISFTDDIITADRSVFKALLELNIL